MWFNAVINDINKVADAIIYFDRESKEAVKEAKLEGSVQKHASQLPGILAYRYELFYEIDAIVKYLETLLEKERAIVIRKFMEGYNREMKLQEAKAWSDADEDVVSMSTLVYEASLIRNRYSGIIKSLDTKGYQINNIVKLNTAGIEDLSV